MSNSHIIRSLASRRNGWIEWMMEITHACYSAMTVRANKCRSKKRHVAKTKTKPHPAKKTPLPGWEGSGPRFESKIRLTSWTQRSTINTHTEQIRHSTRLRALTTSKWKIPRSSSCEGVRSCRTSWHLSRRRGLEWTAEDSGTATRTSYGGCWPTNGERCAKPSYSALPGGQWKISSLSTFLLPGMTHVSRGKKLTLAQMIRAFQDRCAYVALSCASRC